MSRYRIQQVDFTVVVLNGTATISAVPTVPINGLVRAIYVDAPALTSANYTVSINGPKTGQVLFSKASLTPNAKSNVLADANNAPLNIPVVEGSGVGITTAGNEAADRSFTVTLLIDREG